MTYITEAELATYCTARGLTVQATSLPLIIKASDFITATYDGNLIGKKADENQELLFPRVDDYGIAINETSLKKAVCVLSLKAQDGELFEDISKRVIEETLDVLTVKYDTNSTQKTIFSEVNALMRPYTISSGNSLKAVR